TTDKCKMEHIKSSTKIANLCFFSLGLCPCSLEIVAANMRLQPLNSLFVVTRPKAVINTAMLFPQSRCGFRPVWKCLRPLKGVIGDSYPHGIHKRADQRVTSGTRKHHVKLCI